MSYYGGGGQNEWDMEVWAQIAHVCSRVAEATMVAVLISWPIATRNFQLVPWLFSYLLQVEFWDFIQQKVIKKKTLLDRYSWELQRAKAEAFTPEQMLLELVMISFFLNAVPCVLSSLILGFLIMNW